ncbi:MAG: asparagine synthase (glutamine-hydrolyzing) [Legionella sp.]|nr:asparagine synthase (glutamine-hydrolyzing) [Legionella sp.]
MCGFSGYLSSVNRTNPSTLLTAMGEALHHRGPDAQNFWFDEQAGIGLSHARLAIVDLSVAGQQPMHSSTGRYVIVFNGEIYNHLQLRARLSHQNFRGHSDTETLLAAIEAWGLEETLKQAIGMFALALWDCQEKQLFLARDRAGEKPLYYGWQENNFIFGSELKALKVHPAFKREINQQALSLFLRYNYIPAPHAIYQNIYKLAPGTILSVSLRQKEPKAIPYWSFTEVIDRGQAQLHKGSEHEVIAELEQLLINAVGQQMVADVPLGAFLSGGVDSSTIVALMQAQSARPVRTFSIGFQEAQFDEAPYARAIAAHLGTQHTELYINTTDAQAIIPKLPGLYDEPFADSSQIPTFLVAELARQQVKVALSGDAGDELFCGYNRYVLTSRLWKKINKIPLPMRQKAALMLNRVAPATYEHMVDIVPFLRRYKQFAGKMHKASAVLASGSVLEAYEQLIAHHAQPEKFLHSPKIVTNRLPQIDSLDEISHMMALDFMSYLPDDILVKVDRAAMGVSLETRVPFLDHRIIEFAWSMPLALKLHAGKSKWPLRQILYRYVPEALIERPKMGFAIPLAEWLRGSLRPWTEELLAPKRLQQEGFFNADEVSQLWQRHLEGKGNHAALLWNILMFQAWYVQQ